MNERIFYIEQEADLSELLQIIKNARVDTVVLVVPRHAFLFESIVNLQILRSTAEAERKKLIVVTPFTPGRKMSETVGLPTFSSLESWEQKIPEDATVAVKNEPPTKTRGNIKKVPIMLEKTGKETKAEQTEPINWRELLTRPSWQALGLLCIFALGLLLFLFFLALPGATITITPERKGIETITNVELLSVENGAGNSVLSQGTIAAFPIVMPFEKTLDFPTLTKIFEGQNATGSITIFNGFPEQRDLKPTTRFQTAEGLVFRITDWANVPAATRGADGKLLPGTVRANVIADEKDVNGEFVGAQGNIAPTRFFLPALPESSRPNFWAESDEPFTKGVTAWRTEITTKDIAAAKTKMQSELLAGAENDLKTFLAAKNQREHQDLAFFPGEEFSTKEVSDIVVDEGLLGKNQERFEVHGKVTMSTWAYSAAELHDLLASELSTKTDPKMRLTAIDFDASSADLLEQDARSGRMKITITARGAEEFRIDPRSEAGILFVNAIKAQIVGKSIADAEAVLSNREEVANAEISVWPFWSRNIPSLPENIAIELKEE